MGVCYSEQRIQKIESFNSDPNFIEHSLQLLVANRKLSPRLIQSQQIILQKLKQLYRKNKKHGCLAIGKDEFFAYRKNSIFFVGTMSQHMYQGDQCTAIFSGDKIFSGSFKKGHVNGAGLLQFRVQSINRIKFTGKWDERISGHLQINQSGNKRYLQVNRDNSKNKNIKFIEYPNFDTYLGEIQNQVANGFGKYVFRCGNAKKQYPYYEGMFVKGIRNGEGQMHFNSNFILKINWENGKPDGDGMLTLGSQCQLVYFQNGQRVISRPSMFNSKTYNDNPQMSYF